MELVERVARSIGKAENASDWSEYIPHAREAIEAMRTPTRAMLHAGQLRAGGTDIIGLSTVENIYVEMIDVALNA